MHRAYQGTQSGFHSTRRVDKEAPTFQYISKLMELLIQTVEDPAEVWELWNEVEEPPFLCSDFVRPKMSDAVAMHTSRFSKP